MQLSRRHLVTGATGFLGTHLVEELRRQGFALRLLCRGASRWDNNPDIEIHRGDVLDRNVVGRAVAGIAGIFHLAGLVSRDKRDEPRLYDVHLRGTRYICEAAVHEGSPRLVLASSSGTLAVSREPTVHDESSPYASDVTRDWPYYQSKIFQEKMAWSYHRHQGLPLVVINPSLLLGPGDDRRSSTRDVAVFLDGFIRNYPAGGLNFVDVRDTAAAMARAMTDGRNGQRYLIGGTNMTFREFFRLTARVAGKRPLRFPITKGLAAVYARVLGGFYRLAKRTCPLDPVSVEMAFYFWYLRNDRAVAELGLRTRPAEETLRDTVDYLRRS
ncbi:MAG: NAD-dependent epimerase/dehydratase family protein [Acidobacteriota bacterium]